MAEGKAEGGGRESIKHGQWGAVIVGFMHKRLGFQKVGGPQHKQFYQTKKRNSHSLEPPCESHWETDLFSIWNLLQPPREASTRAMEQKGSLAHL